MKFKPNQLIIIFTVMAISTTVMANQNTPLHMKTYMKQGVISTDQENGRQLWNSTKNKRSCTSCHGNDLTKEGKHAKTGKIIQPMALSVNGKRYQKGKKIEKWFLRNCKWTFGRQCNTQEKADILSWLSNQ